MEDYAETVKKAKEAWQIWAEVSEITLWFSEMYLVSEGQEWRKCSPPDVGHQLL